MTGTGISCSCSWCYDYLHLTQVEGIPLTKTKKAGKLEFLAELNERVQTLF